MKSIEKIEMRVPSTTKRKRVAAYARVSMLSDRMEHSLSAQISYYSNLIQQNPEWKYAGVYADDFVSGTTIDRRAEFKRMLNDCESGKIDLILTKSISRFARNTLDLLITVRRLKELGIEVHFERENIHSLRGEGELLLTLLATFAQEESRSLSENVKWGTVKRFQQGIQNGKFRIYGYRWIGDNLVVEPEEAKIVRFIFDNYLHGISIEATERQLKERGIRSYKGLYFGNSSIRAILRNITYTGDLVFQKEFIEDPLTKKRKRNHGELPKYLVKNHHEAIIAKKAFLRVQGEIARRQKIGLSAYPNTNTNCFTSKLKCSNCGMSYRIHTCKRNGRCTHFWMCRTKDEKGIRSCDSKNLSESALINACCKVLGLSRFSKNVFSKRVARITVCAERLLIFHMTDGTEINHTWEKSTARKTCWVPEPKSNWEKLLMKRRKGF